MLPPKGSLSLLTSCVLCVCVFSDAAYSPIAHGSPDVTGGAEEKKDSEAKQD